MIMDTRGPVRLSGLILFKYNLLDPLTLVSTCATYLLCLVIGRHLSALGFLTLFASIIWLFQRHIESYRSFRVTRRWVRALERDEELVSAFLAVNFIDDCKPARAVERHVDTYLWINRIINFFWPYLSHVVHHELNEFLAQSGSLAQSRVGLKRFLYALVRQLDANILAIEHCELGARAPFIKSLVVSNEGARNKTMVYDLDLAYEGNMNMSFICRYCCCCSSQVGFKDVFVHLKSRLMIGPIISEVPSVEAIAFSLLEQPAFGYKGIALVELAELKVAKRSIDRLIKDHLLYPKQIRLTAAELQAKMKERERSALEAAQQVARDGGSGGEFEEVSASPVGRPALGARILAQLAYFACICSNGCLRCCCQQERRRASERQGC